MPIRGKVKDGKVHLDNPRALPEGAEVEVRAVKKPKKAPKPKKRAPRKTMAEWLAPFIGKVKGLPPDMSQNLDHYLYGHPKQS